MKNIVAVAIPVYKPVINPLERISINQVFSVLGDNYEIYYIMPDSLKIIDDLPMACIIRFPDEFFKSTKTYSKLLLSVNFYHAFDKYKYILIYQLDAFIFADRLQYFCSLDYDYIGAIAPRLFWPYLKKRVGNGGLSLRKISSMIRVIHNKDVILERAERELPKDIIQVMLTVEDEFWGYCSTLGEIGIKTPSIDIARRFSIEYDVAHAYQYMKKKLPFGCHRWYSDNFDVWWPIIEKYGYTLSDDEKRQYTASGIYMKKRKKNIKDYLIHRIIRENNVGRMRSSFSQDLLLGKLYSIWGLGKFGMKCVAFLDTAGIRIDTIYDKNAKDQSFYKMIPIVCPTDTELMKKKSKIIITTIKYQKELMVQLDKIGLVRGEDYFTFSDIEYRMCKAYYQYNK